MRWRGGRGRDCQTLLLASGGCSSGQTVQLLLEGAQRGEDLIQFCVDSQWQPFWMVVDVSCSPLVLNLTCSPFLHFTLIPTTLTCKWSGAMLRSRLTVAPLVLPTSDRHISPGGDLPGARRGAEVAAEGNCSNSSLDCLGTAECAEVEPAPTRQQRVRGNGHLLEGATLLGQLCAKSNPCLLLALLQRLLIEVSAQGEQCHQLGIRRKADSLSVSRI